MCLCKECTPWELLFYTVFVKPKNDAVVFLVQNLWLNFSVCEMAQNLEPACHNRNLQTCNKNCQWAFKDVITTLLYKDIFRMMPLCVVRVEMKTQRKWNMTKKITLCQTSWRNRSLGCQVIRFSAINIFSLSCCKTICYLQETTHRGSW